MSNMVVQDQNEATVAAMEVETDGSSKSKLNDEDAAATAASDEMEDIDDDQLEEYREMIDNLGEFPDKVKINTLSMIAEDYADSKHSAKLIYGRICEQLRSAEVKGARKLPIVYVIDSILKNVKGQFTSLVEEDAASWIPIVHRSLNDAGKGKLKKVWKLWWEKRVGFQESKWKAMGACFDAAAAASSGGSGAAGDGSGDGMEAMISNDDSDPYPSIAGIPRKSDGSLVLSTALRNAMQSVLDEMQNDMENELEKVSLERVATIDPNLLAKIKEIAEANVTAGGLGSAAMVDLTTTNATNAHDDMAFLIEKRSPATIAESEAWLKLDLKIEKEVDELMASLNKSIADGSSTESRYTQTEALDMSNCLAVGAVTAHLLEGALKQLKIEEKATENDKQKSSTVASVGFQQLPKAYAIDRKLFTQDGLKQKNAAVIGMLYEVGLPFVSSSDGRRFASQRALSDHMDALFKKTQLERAMTATEERGWYSTDDQWCSNASATGNDPATTNAPNTAASAQQGDSGATNQNPDLDADPTTNPDACTVPADESRDRCAICGVNFQMVFDNDDGIYKYKNCREMDVMNDDVAERESEEMLVHVTCWKALGAPDVLTRDQIIHDNAV